MLLSRFRRWYPARACTAAVRRPLHACSDAALATGMQEALGLAALALAEGEIPVGAVVLDAVGGVVGRGRQCGGGGACAVHAHAEVLALTDACERAGARRLDGHTLVVTLEPCLMCYGAALLHRLDAVVFAAPSPKYGVRSASGALAGERWGEEGGGGSSARPYRGVYAGVARLVRGGSPTDGDASAALLRAFFEERR